MIRRPGQRFNRGRIATAIVVAPPPPGAPVLVSAAIDAAGTSLTLTYNEALDAGSTPATGAFSLAGTLGSSVTAVLVTGSAVVLTVSPAVVSTETVTVSYTPGGSPIQDLVGDDAAPLVNEPVTNGSTVVPTPLHIFAGTGGMDQYIDTSVSGAANVTGGLVTQINDLSGSGHHEVPSGTSPNPARQPTYNSTDARVNNQPSITYQGEAESSANRDQTSATGWARSAPPRWIYTVLVQEGPNLGTNRALLSDLTLNAYTLYRPSGSGSSVPTLVMRNTTAANSNAGIADGTWGVHELYFSNSLLTDYLKIKGTVANGQNAGNSAGTEAQTGVTSAGNAWSWHSFCFRIQTNYLPSMLQLSQVDAYVASKFGSGVL